SCKECDILRDPVSVAAALKCRPGFIVNTLAESEVACSHLTLAERVGDAAGDTSLYAPILFFRGQKLTRNDKLLSTFSAFALAQVQQAVPPYAKIVYGSEREV